MENGKCPLREHSVNPVNSVVSSQRLSGRSPATIAAPVTRYVCYVCYVCYVFISR